MKKILEPILSLVRLPAALESLFSRIRISSARDRGKLRLYSRLGL